MHLKEVTLRKCKWKYKDKEYITSCNNKVIAIGSGEGAWQCDGIGTLDENKFKYCPYCGKEIEEEI